MERTSGVVFIFYHVSRIKCCCCCSTATKDPLATRRAKRSSEKTLFLSFCSSARSSARVCASETANTYYNRKKAFSFFPLHASRYFVVISPIYIFVLLLQLLFARENLISLLSSTNNTLNLNDPRAQSREAFPRSLDANNKPACHFRKTNDVFVSFASLSACAQNSCCWSQRPSNPLSDCSRFEGYSSPEGKDFKMCNKIGNKE